MGFFKKRKRTACSIGIIGGADGPTAVFCAEPDKEAAEKWERFLNRAAGQIRENAHDFSEIGAYLAEHYHAEPYEMTESERQMLKVNVIANHYADQLVFPPPLSERPTKKELMRYAEEDTTFEQAREIPEERLGLLLEAYRIPRKGKEAIVFLDRKSGYLSAQGGDESFWNDLQLWIGVTKADIDNRTPRFIAYAQMMKEMGKLDLPQKNE